MRKLILAATVMATFATNAMALDVTFVNPGGEDGFWGAVTKTMQAAANDLDINLDVVHSNRDRFVMVDAVRDIASSADKPDYVVLVNELQQGPQMAAALSEVGIPSFFLLNRLSEEQLAEAGDLQLVGSVVPDNEIAGYEMAKSLIEAARSAGKDGDGVQILALLGDSATPAALQREAGLKRAVAEAGDAEIVRDFAVNWSADEAKERTALFLKRQQVDAIWAANDPIAFGAREAAEAAGFTAGSDIFFVGLNWSAPALEAVDDGTMTLTHGGHFFAGAWSMVMLKDIASGASAAGADVEFPMSAVTPENVAAFLRDIAPGDYEAIDFASFLLSAQNSTNYSFTAESILGAAGG